MRLGARFALAWLWLGYRLAVAWRSLGSGCYPASLWLCGRFFMAVLPLRSGLAVAWLWLFSAPALAGRMLRPTGPPTGALFSRVAAGQLRFT